MELCSLVSRVTITGSGIPVVEVNSDDEEEEGEEEEQGGDANGGGDPEVEPDTVTYISLMQ